MAPTVIYVPEAVQYPEGFDVVVSDGMSEYHKDACELWYSPENDGEHWIEIRPKTGYGPISLSSKLH